MLLAMYWGDSEEEKKKRLEEKLRQKKAKKMGEIPPPPGPVPPPLPDNAEIIEDDGSQSLLDEHSGEIRDLKHLIIQQSKMLQQIMEKQDTPRYEVIHKPSAEEIRIKEKDPSLPTLGELDVRVVKTDGIETQGEAGQTKQGESVKDRAAKLRALKNKRGK